MSNKFLGLNIVLFFYVSILFFSSNLLCFEHKDWVYVDFDISMSKESNEGYKLCMDDGGTFASWTGSLKSSEVMNMFKKVFNKNNISTLDSKKRVQGIPKIIHQIWLGGPLPEQDRILIETWKKFHPDWEHRLWTDKDVENFDLYNRELYDRSNNYREKANILRLEILNKFGGLYVDTDFECLKSFDVLNENYDFYTSLAPMDEGRIYLTNGLFASIPGHPILQYCIKLLSYTKNLKMVILRSGVYPFTKSVIDSMKKFELENTIVFPASYFYPVGSRSKALMNKKFRDDDTLLNEKIRECPESFGVHYWYSYTKDRK